MKDFLLRDVSWLAFNMRVSDESKRDIPMEEQVMFQGISFSNLDEFMMVRYPSFIEKASGFEWTTFTNAVQNHYMELLKRFRKFNNRTKLVRQYRDLSKRDKEWITKLFRKKIFPVLQPIEARGYRPLHLHSGIYMITIVKTPDDDSSIHYIEIPRKLDRFIQVQNKNYVVDLLDIINCKSKMLYGKEKHSNFPISILHSAEVYISADTSDPVKLVEETLSEREKSWITRVEIGSDKKSHLELIKDILPLTNDTIIFAGSNVGLASLKNIPSGVYPEGERRRERKIYQTFPESGIFDFIRNNDRLVFHPYESYDGSVVRLLEEAAVDPDVKSIKITLYRVANNSKIIRELLRAADNGIHVSALIELKARFDESHNIKISKILREGGVRIIYTDPNIKTHAKMLLITRKEGDRIRIYSHVGTGNYSETNSRQYTDYSYFTAKSKIGNDLSQLFNLIANHKKPFKSERLIYAPYNMRDEIVSAIRHEMERAKKRKKARIICKCNSFDDTKMAERLIDAADQGVEVILIIRGACILQPRKNIQIYSIVGQYLEHSRVYAFGYGKHSKVYIGSADLMYRNLSLRHELLLRVDESDIKKRLLKHLSFYLKDTELKRTILNRYKYEIEKSDKHFNCQEAFTKEARSLKI